MVFYLLLTLVASDGGGGFRDYRRWICLLMCSDTNDDDFDRLACTTTRIRMFQGGKSSCICRRQCMDTFSIERPLKYLGIPGSSTIMCSPYIQRERPLVFSGKLTGLLDRNTQVGFTYSHSTA